jgi:hypothetical protein
MISPIHLAGHSCDNHTSKYVACMPTAWANASDRNQLAHLQATPSFLTLMRQADYSFPSPATQTRLPSLLQTALLGQQPTGTCSYSACCPWLHNSHRCNDDTLLCSNSPNTWHSRCNDEQALIPHDATVSWLPCRCQRFVTLCLCSSKR